MKDTVNILVALARELTRSALQTFKNLNPVIRRIAVAPKEKRFAASSQVIAERFQWSLQDGQLFAPDLGYIQMPASVAEKPLAALNKIEADG
jgi:hypothetical protein